MLVNENELIYLDTPDRIPSIPLQEEIIQIGIKP